MSQPIIREAVQDSDIAAVHGIVAATGFFSDEEVVIAAELVEEALQKGSAASGYEFVMAEVDGVLKGYSCYGLIPCSTVSWDLYWIAVDPDQQGSGLGRTILELTEKRIAQKGGLAVYAETSGKDLYVPTRAFYLRRGYETGAGFADFYAPGDAKYVFVKRLAQNNK